MNEKRKRNYVCDDCGKAFQVEENGDMYQPTPYIPRCPQCGGYHTRPSSFLGINRILWRTIWDD